MASSHTSGSQSNSFLMYSFYNVSTSSLLSSNFAGILFICNPYAPLLAILKRELYKFLAGASWVACVRTLLARVSWSSFLWGRHGISCSFFTSSSFYCFFCFFLWSSSQWEFTFLLRSFFQSSIHCGSLLSSNHFDCFSSLENISPCSFSFNKLQCYQMLDQEASPYCLSPFQSPTPSRIIGTLGLSITFVAQGTVTGSWESFVYESGYFNSRQYRYRLG